MNAEELGKTEALEESPSTAELSQVESAGAAIETDAASENKVKATLELTAETESSTDQALDVESAQSDAIDEGGVAGAEAAPEAAESAEAESSDVVADESEPSPADPAAVDPEASEPETVASDAETTDVVADESEPSSADPAAVEPEASEPEAVASDAETADVVADESEPSSADPAAVEPEASEPEAVASDAESTDVGAEVAADESASASETEASQTESAAVDPQPSEPEAAPEKPDPPKYRRGQVFSGVITKTSPTAVLVDLGDGDEGVVPGRELELMTRKMLESLTVGANIDVYVVNPRNHRSETVLSINHALEELDWRKAKEYAKSKAVYEALIGGYNKGGLIVRFGRLRGFVPQSQLSEERARGIRGETPEERYGPMVNQPIGVKVMEVDRGRNRLILSERARDA